MRLLEEYRPEWRTEQYSFLTCGALVPALKIRLG